MGVQLVEPILQGARDELAPVTLEVAVDVVRVVLVLEEGSIDEDLRDSYLPKLSDEDLEVVDQLLPPSGVPLRVVRTGTLHEHRLAEIVERELEAALRQDAVRSEIRQP